MGFRITVPNKEVARIAARVREQMPDHVLRVGPRFYCHDYATAVSIAFLTDIQKIEQR